MSGTAAGEKDGREKLRAEGRRRHPAVALLASTQRRLPLAQLVALVALFAYGATTLPGFSSRLSIDSMLVLASLLGFAAAGQTIVILIGALDLSVAGFVLAGATITVQLTSVEGWPFAAALGLVVATAVVGGGASGFVCHRYRASPVVVTLGMGSIAAGAMLVWTKGVVLGTAPSWLQRAVAPSGTTFGVRVPPVVVIWLILVVGIGAFLARTVAGRRIYLTGSNLRAARLSLVNTERVWMVAFATSALLSALTGVLVAGFAGAGDTSLGDPYLFQGLTAVIIGGTAFGARGDYWRTTLGALLLTEISTILVGRGYSYAVQQILFGLLILAVVGFYGRDERLRDRV